MKETTSERGRPGNEASVVWHIMINVFCEGT